VSRSNVGGYERRRDDDRAPWNQPQKPHATKNTRTWCKGKVGREHKPEAVVPANAGRGCHETGWFDRESGHWQDRGYWDCRHVIACADCGKVLKRWIACPEKPEGLKQWTPWWAR
jgi:hypothetical protein